MKLKREEGRHGESLTRRHLKNVLRVSGGQQRRLFVQHHVYVSLCKY